LADSLECQFQAVNDSSYPAVIEKVAEALQAHSYAPAREHKVRNPMEAQDAIWRLKVGEATGPDGSKNRALKHFPKRPVCFLVALFNAALLAQYIAKYGNTRFDFNPENRKGPSLPSSIGLLDTIGKLFERSYLVGYYVK
jgi:hypothetical protein